MLTHTQLTECSKIYSEFAEKYGKLPKQFREIADDFCKVFAEYLPDAVSVQIRQWFKAYLADYIPQEAGGKRQEAGDTRRETRSKKQEIRDEKQEIRDEKQEEKEMSKTEQAKALRAGGKSFVEIGKILGVSDKTAKKLCEGL